MIVQHCSTFVREHCCLVHESQSAVKYPFTKTRRRYCTLPSDLCGKERRCRRPCAQQQQHGVVAVASALTRPCLTSVLSSRYRRRRRCRCRRRCCSYQNIVRLRVLYYRALTSLTHSRRSRSATRTTRRETSFTPIKRLHFHSLHHQEDRHCSGAAVYAFARCSCRCR